MYRRISESRATSSPLRARITSRTSSCSRWSLSGDRAVANWGRGISPPGAGRREERLHFATLTLRLRLLEASSRLWIIQVRRRRHSSRRRLVSPPTESPSFDPGTAPDRTSPPPKVTHEVRRSDLPDVLPCGLPDRPIARDEEHTLGPPVLRSQALQQLVCRLRKPDRQASVTSWSSPTPSKTTTPRAPRRATKEARRSTSSCRSAHSPAWSRL